MIRMLLAAALLLGGFLLVMMGVADGEVRTLSLGLGSIAAGGILLAKGLET